MNKFFKGLAVCSAVLMGSLAFSGCSMSKEQELALEKLTSHTDEIASVIDKQNKSLSKKEAMEMIELGRSEISYMWRSTSLSANVAAIFGTSINDVRFKASNQDYDSELEVVMAMDFQNNVTKLLTKEDNSTSFTLKDYENQQGYTYNGTTAIKHDSWADQQVPSGGDPFTGCGLQQIYEEDIYDIVQNDDGSYEFIISTERTYEENDNTFQSGIFNINIKVKDSKIISCEIFVIAAQYNKNDQDWEKDKYGNYITRHLFSSTNSVVYYSANYAYDEDVDLKELNNIYAQAEEKYNETYPQS